MSSKIKNSSEMQKLKLYLALWLMPNFGKHHWRSLLEEGVLDINSQLNFLANLQNNLDASFFKTKKTPKFKSSLLSLSAYAQTALTDINKLTYANLIYKHLDWLASSKLNFILTYDEFPLALKQIKDPPILLCATGDKQTVTSSSIAVVGSRNASANGRKVAFDFGAHLAKELIVVSGLALGIDGEAHKGALMSGKTLAVMATGIDVIYPRTHLSLAKKIVENGAIITEMPLGTAPLPGLFPVRNRIIVGISLGAFVVEASARSGSLISARLANEFGRSVYAAPSMLNNPQTYGTNKLIQEGATIVLEAEDILKDLRPQLTELENSTNYNFSSSNQLRFDIKNINNSPKSASDNLDLQKKMSQQERTIWDKLGASGVSTDDLCNITQMSVQDVQTILMQFELKGLVEQIGGGWIKIL